MNNAQLNRREYNTIDLNSADPIGTKGKLDKIMDYYALMVMDQQPEIVSPQIVCQL